MTCDHEQISVANAMVARKILKNHLLPSPLRRYPSIDGIVGARVYVKHENQNPTGTFKIRGGINLLHNLTAKGINGKITYSTGNNGTSVATSARMFNQKSIERQNHGNPNERRKCISP
ncbi:pyridoxal-phosphate dependent enzyme [uncultured Desulfobacter sp.]|uniref:pyridoxal-phosphate dependent enzyme n=1 Tax=uncultured Desulfobacter sp. TaxID=240139 RepID=UPI0029F525BE|nr:pyridoxal-phosphate dependent enzyme [uncultured Desulfobacter sp.]